MRMDTYFNVDMLKCNDCGKCVDACPQDFIVREEYYDKAFDNCIGEITAYYTGACEYVPCHHCTGFWERNTPCLEVCEYGAISLSRW